MCIPLRFNELKKLIKKSNKIRLISDNNIINKDKENKTIKTRYLNAEMFIGGTGEGTSYSFKIIKNIRHCKEKSQDQFPIFVFPDNKELFKMSGNDNFNKINEMIKVGENSSKYFTNNNIHF
jgi:hypothetical protein